VLPLAYAGLLALMAGCVASNEPATPSVSDADPDSEDYDLTGSVPVGTELYTTTDVNQRREPSLNGAIMTVLPPGTRVKSASARSKDGWYGVTSSVGTGWINGAFLAKSAGSEQGIGRGSRQAARQMRDVIDYAYRNNSGASRGRCFEYVWRYLTSSGYGRLDNYYDAPDMPSAYARNFAEYMNRNGNAARWGLVRLPISNPYDAPAGAVVVVAPGSPGTSHPIAGDIAIAAGGGRFINDGPYMGYGGSRGAFTYGGGRVLGIYVPE